MQVEGLTYCSDKTWQDQQHSVTDTVQALREREQVMPQHWHDGVLQHRQQRPRKSAGLLHNEQKEWHTYASKAYKEKQRHTCGGCNHS
jgi:hypothetical protein